MEDINERLDNLIWLMNEIENTYVKNELCDIKEKLSKLNDDNSRHITEIKQTLCENK